MFVKVQFHAQLIKSKSPSLLLTYTILLDITVESDRHRLSLLDS